MNAGLGSRESAVVAPYVAAFRSRFLQMLQYRAAAFAGFLTQCWWGGIKVMVYGAFYAAAPAAASMTFGQVATYTWLAQGLLSLSPWQCDPEVALAMRSGAVGYDRLRPVDHYAFWYSRAAGWMLSRVLPRVLLMYSVAGVVLPVIGLGPWAWGPPAGVGRALVFVLSLALAAALSSAFIMLLNIAVVVTLNDRWVNASLSPFTIVLSGNLLPLALYPGWAQAALFVQPMAGVLDIPLRIYSGALTGWMVPAGLALQVVWTIVIVMLGRAWMRRVMRRLEVQGG